MTDSVIKTGICLHALPAREEAVVKRVISFSETQGRNYTLSAMNSADLLLTSDDTTVDLAAMNPAGCMIIRIADPGTTQAYDILMQRPLLVTKVMRTLDEAKALLKASRYNPENDKQKDDKQENEQGDKQVMPPVMPAAPVEPTLAVNTPAAPAVSTVVHTTTTEEDAAKESRGTVDETVAQTAAIALQTSGIPQQAKPALSLYAQIMGRVKADKTPVQGATTPTPASEPAEPEHAQQSPDDANAASVPAPDDVPHTSGAEEATPLPSQPASSQSIQSQSINEPAESVAGEATVATSQEPNDFGEVVQSASAVTEPDVPGEIVEQPPVQNDAEYHHLALVVDDSSAIRKQLELELKDAGIRADFAETGEEALEKVAAKRYDLVFLDIIMPGIDGYEACRQMRIRAEMKKTPIIMLSAKTSPLDEVQGVIAGASTYLTKPVKSEQLQKTLKRVSMWLDNFQVTA